MGSSPGWTYGYVPTAGEWNLWWSNKQDNLGFTPLNSAGGTMLGLLNIQASTTAGADLNLAPGSAPTAPNNGDVWTTTAGLFYEASGVTYGPLLSSPRLSVIKRGISFQSATDILLSFQLPNGIPSYFIAQAHIANASAPLTTGSIGLYTGSGAGGTAIVSSTALNITTISGNTSGNMMGLTVIGTTTQSFNATTLYFHITGGVGSAVTADLILELFLQ